MHVALLGRERAALEETAASLSGPSICVECDVTDRTALAEAAQRVETECRPASVAVANAGIAVSGPFDHTDAELRQRVIDVNLTGSARAFLPQLTATRGYFLQIASTAAFGSAPIPAPPRPPRTTCPPRPRTVLTRRGPGFRGGESRPELLPGIPLGPPADG
nr:MULTISPECIES: SDR family NAD(P)-dependent oxidoreductase [unclassified Streptomyces]